MDDLLGKKVIIRDKFDMLYELRKINDNYVWCYHRGGYINEKSYPILRKSNVIQDDDNGGHIFTKVNFDDLEYKHALLEFEEIDNGYFQ